MTCRKVRKLMPLAAGDDLRPRLAAAVRAHIDACPGCREELEAFRSALAGIKAAAKAECVADWREDEWDAMMSRIAAGTAGAGDALSTGRPRVLAPQWAAASALGAVIGLAVLSMLFRGPSPQPQAEQGEGGLILASEASPQEKVAITMVSPETGLQVVWFLDKNFDYEGEQE